MFNLRIADDLIRVRTWGSFSVLFHFPGVCPADLSWCVSLESWLHIFPLVRQPLPALPLFSSKENWKKCLNGKSQGKRGVSCVHLSSQRPKSCWSCFSYFLSNELQELFYVKLSVGGLVPFKIIHLSPNQKCAMLSMFYLAI